MLFCLDDLDKKKHRDVINSYKFLLFVLDITWDSNPHYRPARIPDTLRIRGETIKGYSLTVNPKLIDYLSIIID